MTQSTLLTPGTVALVTGATSGIGRAVVVDLIEHGLKVVCVGRSHDALVDLCDHCGDKVAGVALDVCDADFADNLKEALPEEFADISILVAAAGSDIGGRQRFDAGTMEDWAGTIETNVTGLMASCHAVLPGMLARGRGHIVTIGSVSGQQTYAGGSVYSASKYAVRAFTESLRKDYQTEPVRITEVLPGLVRTGFAQARHAGDTAMADEFYAGFPDWLTADEVADTVIYALSAPDHVNIAQLVVTPTGNK